MVLQEQLDQQAAIYRQASSDYQQRRLAGPVDLFAERKILAELYTRVSQWFRDQADSYPCLDHTDRLFVDRILLARARTHLSRAEYLADPEAPITEGSLCLEYRRLDSLFQAAITSFERKQYVNLSHEPNKAMNLNSYIELLGKHWREVARDDGLHLEQVPADDASGYFPGAEYIITLDADSLLLPDYALRLIHIMEQPGNERMAVAQTPYSAVPDSPKVVERIAGATTDIQYIIHQGFTRFNATFWVGANAVLRKAALMDIRLEEEERGFPVARYIQDRTVIEDTESTVDLVHRGWRLYNYPERMSYSATPPDFGSLLIQRRRWANGGLIILPKLIRYLFSRPFRRSKVGEGVMRVHYLISITAVNFGLLLLLMYPFEEAMRNIWLPLSALPYFYLYGRDMVHLGYRWSDLPRVYALNLMLVPVNLGGVLKSVQQGVSGKKIPFGRTPKILGRTAAPRMYVLAELGLVVYIFFAASMDLLSGKYVHSAFSLANGILFLYVIWRFIGVKESKQDILLGTRKLSLRRKRKFVGVAELESRERVHSEAD